MTSSRAHSQEIDTFFGRTNAIRPRGRSGGTISNLFTARYVSLDASDYVSEWNSSVFLSLADGLVCVCVRTFAGHRLK